MILDRKKAPGITDAINYKLALKPYEKFVLNNGVPVYLVNAGAQEVLQVEWVFFAGNTHETKNGVAAATNFLLRNGTSTKTALEINEAFEFYGASCGRACYNEHATIGVHTLSKHIDKLLPVVREMFIDSVFPQTELDIYIQNAQQRLAVNLQKCEFVAGRLMDEYLYGANHPYGRNTNIQDLAAITRDDVLNFHKAHYLGAQCAIFVSGNFSQNITAAIEQTFGDLPLVAPNTTSNVGLPQPANELKHRVQNDANAVQGAIRLASPFPNRHHPDFKKLHVLNTLFGGFFGSRLMANIREDKGYTYGIYSYLQNHIASSAIMISTEAGKDVCEAAIAEVYKEMERLRNEPIADDELMLVRNYMMGSILGDLDGPFHIMARWKSIILNNLPEDYFNHSIETIKTISKEELQALANKYYLSERFYELIVY